MLICVFSQYKYFVHLQTKSLQAENISDIVKRIIIGLEEINFQVLSIITDKKLYLSIVIYQSFQLYIHIRQWSLDLFSFYLIQFIHQNALEIIGLVKICK